MSERRKKPPAEIWQNPQVNRGGLVVSDRPRKVVVQGQQGAEHSPASRNQSRLGGWLLAPSEGAPESPTDTKRKMTVDARLRVGVLGFALAAIVISTNALGSFAEATGSIASRVKASIVSAKQSVTVETLAPLLVPKDEWRNTSASSASHMSALNGRCVRPEVYRIASDLNRFWWLLRDRSGRTIKEASNTYASETEARMAADDAATKQACNARVTGTHARNGNAALSSTN